MADDEATSNGRVTLALLKHDISKLSERLEETHQLLAHSVDRTDERLRSMENRQARDDERIKGMGKEINDLSKRSNLIDAASAMGTAFAIFLGLNRP